MRKMLSLFMILLLCLGLLIGCTPKDDNAAALPSGDIPTTDPAPFDPKALLAQIPEALQRQIKDEFLTQKSPTYAQRPEEIDTVSLRVFGIFEDAYALFLDGGFFGYAEMIWGETVNGELLFHLPNTQCMYIYRRGQFYSLEEAFAQQVITWENVTIIRDNYCSAYPKFAPEPQATLPEELENLKHYGPYDGWFLLIYPGQLQAVSYQEVAGFVFSSSSSFSMKAYKDGATYPLPDAYDQDILQDADVERIDYWYQRYT